MTHVFDPGPVVEPYLSLARDYPGHDVYPGDSFRVEWGPVFHRGRLDGSARVLVIGQEPTAFDHITRRILVGEAGHRVQGLLAKLGIDRSYVAINTFLYSFYGREPECDHRHDPAIVGYRHRWLDALVADNTFEVVIALGALADEAWQKWKRHAEDALPRVGYAHVTHPTEPETSSGGDPDELGTATAAMLSNWNHALRRLHPTVITPDAQRELVLYGERFEPSNKAAIPEEDLPAGLPGWMRSAEAWAKRHCSTPAGTRSSVTIVPRGATA
ncbi:MAG: uracil-DNA glycosylase family protein [Thermoleophilaceae bacterium]